LISIRFGWFGWRSISTRIGRNWRLRYVTHCLWESAACAYFVEPPGSPNMPGSPWQFRENVPLEDESEGTVILDVLQNGQIGGAEFLSKL
jgi:hypothetical protein